MSKSYYVDKTTSTPADSLLAFGLAILLTGVAGETDTGLKIIDAGDSYQLDMKQPITDEWVTGVRFFPLYRGLNTAKKKANLPEPLCEDYVAHQQRNQDYFKAREKIKDEDQLREGGFRPPVRNWAAWAVINQMSAVNTYNKLAELWYTHKDCFPDLLAIILNLFHTRPNPFDDAEMAWKALAKSHSIEGKSEVPQLQVINPGMGKGGNRSKATGLSIGGLKGFWVPEYLKFAGLFQAGVPRTVSGEKDRKTYVLRPKELKWDTHLNVFLKFQDALFAASPVKMDILATLHYCQVFLEQWKVGQESTRFRRFGRGNPGNHVAALDTIFYKYLGSAHATMNLSTLVLPEWLGFTVETREQADQFLGILEEHRGVVRNLIENHGDEYELLRRYRDFLSARDLRAFFRFTRGYAKYVMSHLTAGGQYPPRRFTTSNLEVLIMAHEKKYQPILQNQGFLGIAEAIRRSTVSPQYQKSQKKDTLYDIRYGLGDKLLRHAQYNDQFIQELSRFMHDYNRENARKSETRGQQFRKNITTKNIDAILGLIDEFGAPTVANLLVAYGYARDPRSTTSNDE